MTAEVLFGYPAVVVEAANRTRFGGTGELGGVAPADADDADGRARVINVPARVDITVLEPITFTVVARTWSRPDGTWRVPYLNESMHFMVIGTDRSKQVNSAIQDWVLPAPMET